MEHLVAIVLAGLTAEKRQLEFLPCGRDIEKEALQRRVNPRPERRQFAVATLYV